MDIEELRIYCLNKKGTEESFPFGEDTLVFKVLGKIYLLVGIDNKPLQFNIKCEPEKAIQLREIYSSVVPGYHMNKKHWNTIICDGSINKKNIFEWIDDSYNLIVESFSKKEKQLLNNL